MKKNTKENMFELINKAKSNTQTPMQNEKSGIVKPVTKGTYIYIEEHKLIELKKMSAERKTTLKELINSAIDEMYFK
ncbi:hypothetical protein [Bergeyella zoohelcum]|uniref:Uncharacterized protein n=2 Tax=Bergeyella zoohelcum TaxID=1015 RepID=K1MDH1_9FLAO|nr:hypothetical protein [Bergeyella zoohelcum]EKB54134.1 hypothetical protein HMPREF9699_02117 [Bergeyella zoohelcum ATCC 43767]SUV65524.1 Uncharacterised protein [Bergeyella zoohelcum]VDH06584.1 Uncharacterised protein [Bergeyella zoohelcum]